MTKDLLADLICRLNTQFERGNRAEGPKVYDHSIELVRVGLT